MEPQTLALRMFYCVRRLVESYSPPYFLLSLVVAFDLEVEKMDVKTTFLHGDLDEEIYMKQLEGFIVRVRRS